MRVTLASWCLLVVACGSGAPPPTAAAAASSATAPASSVNTSASSEAAPATPSCIGTWAGSAVQDGVPWTLELRITASGAGPCGTIEYPSLGCGGEVLDCGVLPDGRLTMRERYTHNPGTCAPEGRIYALCAEREQGPATMLWTWEGMGGPVTTTLVRR